MGPVCHFDSLQRLLEHRPNQVRQHVGTGSHVDQVQPWILAGCKLSIGTDAGLLHHAGADADAQLHDGELSFPPVLCMSTLPWEKHNFTSHAPSSRSHLLQIEAELAGPSSRFSLVEHLTFNWCPTLLYRHLARKSINQALCVVRFKPDFVSSCSLLPAEFLTMEIGYPLSI